MSPCRTMVAARLAGGRRERVLAAIRFADGRRERAQIALHEVRGPLTAIGLAVALSARQGRLPAERARAIELELARARRALDELEDCGRGGRRHEAGSPVAARELVDLRELLRDSCEAWRARAELHETSLSCRWQGPPAYCWGDRLSLAQVSGNLIANALEHGSGAVVVEGELIAGERTLVRIVISDQGPGLPAAVAQLVRGPRAGRRGRAGARRRGRGLQIAAGIVAAHGGRLGAAPSEQGARLVIELPACSGTPAAVAR